MFSRALSIGVDLTSLQFLHHIKPASTTKLRLTLALVDETKLLVIRNEMFMRDQCNPVSKHWNHQVPGVCWSPEVVPRYAVGAASELFRHRAPLKHSVLTDMSTVYSGVMDILLALIPWPLIMKLRMNKREKLGVAMALASMIL